MKYQESVLRKLSLTGAIVLILWVCWYNLGGMTIRLWDESRMAINALEMYESRHYWVTTFEHQPDLWNTKTPLMIWLQVLSLHIFGVHDWALRIPAALAATATFTAIFHFCYRRLNNFWLGIFSVVVLATSVGYIREHITRTGDFDPLLILWLVLASLNFFIFLEHNRTRSLYATFIFFGLAVCTKGVAGLIFAPGVLLYTIYRRQLKRVLINPHTYIGLLLFLAIALPYYFIREHYNPGYLMAVRENELGGRFLKAKEGHNHPWYWYLNLVATELYVEWWPVFVLGLVFLWIERRSDTLMNKGVIYAAILAISYFTIMSAAQTKLVWYVAPVFPFAAIVVAYTICFIGRKVYVESAKIWRIGQPVLPVLILFVVVHNIYNELYLADRHNNLSDINYYIRDKFMAEKDKRNMFVLAPGYQPHVWWYTRVAARQGQKIVHDSSVKIKAGDRVLVSKGEYMDTVTSRYEVDTLYHTNFIGVFDIKCKKQL
jgi:4-amino-4-deoxy-L-arabinose transferase-like glycosyltransferase